ncbi:MAG: WecB/TagA/CpsF family glycosyltransferase [Bacteroidetes bacterium]|nr:WecB/TagA/CpsF family glycosyltransferase [Bacteroidota bacterium]MBU1114774.1 WecB/TagA/CpsF family glycosyltransferase [Bacteroidota bacterium]MBU1799065.1 WecB/TagA/CpsF family glycosyltransferase [Bacteroidota bacterium]
MIINLNSINKELIVSKINKEENGNSQYLIQYADFNVLNYFYENNYENNELSNFFLYPDSTAVYLYIKLFLRRKFSKIISTDLQNDLLEELNKNKSFIYLFGDSNKILEKTIYEIRQKYTNINVSGSQNGYYYDTNIVLFDINKTQIDVLFVGLGVGRQEKWILENYKKLNVKVIVSVGGWFQYLAGNKKRAPLFMRKIHLEWMHKFILEFPIVWKRYLIGLPKFYFRLLNNKIVIRMSSK